MNRQAPVLLHNKDFWTGRFYAMASPCELLIDIDNERIAGELLTHAFDEAVRIEEKYSRYSKDNIIYHINNSSGRPVEVDDETANLLDYAEQCYRLSEGLFDITSGVLRLVWKFDGSDNVPDQEKIAEILFRVGWYKINWERPMISLPEGMEIDLGGIGKEYAVDKTADILMQHQKAGMLVNYGGDIRVTGPRRDESGWTIGIERSIPARSQQTVTAMEDINKFQITKGGVATSGDARRFLLKDGVRYGHILDPRTGWPVHGAPSSVTVVAGTCTDAGVLSTLAMLHGDQAESFLRDQDVTFWSER